MEWFSRTTSVAGIQIPNWVLVLGAIIIVWLPIHVGNPIAAKRRPPVRFSPGSAIPTCRSILAHDGRRERAILSPNQTDEVLGTHTTGPFLSATSIPSRVRALSQLVLVSILRARCWLFPSYSPFPSDEEAHG